MGTDAVVRYAIQSLAVVSGTGAFVAATSGYRHTAIGFALLSGALGLASVAVQIKREGVLLTPVFEEEPTIGAELSGTARAMLAGRLAGRG